MGHLIHPVASRLGISLGWNSVWVGFDFHQYSQLVFDDFLCNRLLSWFFVKLLHIRNSMFCHLIVLRFFKNILFICFSYNGDFDETWFNFFSFWFKLDKKLNYNSLSDYFLSLFKNLKFRFSKYIKNDNLSNVLNQNSSSFKYKRIFPVSFKLLFNKFLKYLKLLFEKKFKVFVWQKFLNVLKNNKKLRLYYFYKYLKYSFKAQHQLKKKKKRKIWKKRWAEKNRQFKLFHEKWLLKKNKNKFKFKKSYISMYKFCISFFQLYLYDDERDYQSMKRLKLEFFNTKNFLKMSKNTIFNFLKYLHYWNVFNLKSKIFGFLININLKINGLLKFIFFYLSSGAWSASLICRYITVRLQQGAELFDIIKPLILKFSRFELMSGFKISCAGRFTRRQIAVYTWQKKGEVPLNSFSRFVDYQFSNAFLKNSVCGIKVWLCFPLRLIKIKTKGFFISGRSITF